VALDMNKLMRQAQKLQEEIERIQKELAERTVEATAGGGMVRAKVTCDKRLVELVLDKQVVDPADVDMLQDLIIAAVNEAFHIAEETMAGEMSKVTGGMGFPGLPGRRQ
jgi:DNA-binding YbaB/EbfC family protein